MAEFLYVKVHPEIVKLNRVALWEQNQIDPDTGEKYLDHGQAHPLWSHPDEVEGGFNGAYIAGDRKNPDKVYKVLDTPGVRLAIHNNRLVEVQPTPDLVVFPVLPVTPESTPELTPPESTDDLVNSDSKVLKTSKPKADK